MLNNGFAELIQGEDTGHYGFDCGFTACGDLSESTQCASLCISLSL